MPAPCSSTQRVCKLRFFFFKVGWTLISSYRTMQIRWVLVGEGLPQSCASLHGKCPWAGRAPQEPLLSSHSTPGETKKGLCWILELKSPSLGVMLP